MTFTRGQRVKTPLGVGTVVYQRMSPPDYTDAFAVSVKLDSKKNPEYNRTIFPAEAITEE